MNIEDFNNKQFDIFGSKWNIYIVDSIVPEVDEEGYEIATGRTMRKPSKWNAESSYNHW